MLLSVTFRDVAGAGREISEKEGDKRLTPSFTLRAEGCVRGEVDLRLWSHGQVSLGCTPVGAGAG